MMSECFWRNVVKKNFPQNTEEKTLAAVEMAKMYDVHSDNFKRSVIEDRERKKFLEMKYSKEFFENNVLIQFYDKNGDLR